MAIYTDVVTARTATGEPLTPWFMLNMFGNDWALMGGTDGLILVPDIVPSATSPTVVDMQSFWIEFPTYSFDTDYDDLEMFLSLPLEAYVDGGAAGINLESPGATANSVAVSDLAYATQSRLTLQWATPPTGQVRVRVQGSWTSDPGSKTLYTRRNLGPGDVELYVRVTP